MIVISPPKKQKDCSQGLIGHPFFSLLDGQIDNQTELEKEKMRKGDGAGAWIERSRKLETELDWTSEVADRLDRMNQRKSHKRQEAAKQNCLMPIPFYPSLL